MGMTLWSLKTYGYISSKIKSYQIQRGFLLLFIFLGYEIDPSGYMSLGLPNAVLSYTSRLFRRFCSMSFATKFHQNLDAMCIAKASDEDPYQ